MRKWIYLFLKEAIPMFYILIFSLVFQYILEQFKIPINPKVYISYLIGFTLMYITQNIVRAISDVYIDRKLNNLDSPT